MAIEPTSWDAIVAAYIGVSIMAMEHDQSCSSPRLRMQLKQGTQYSRHKIVCQCGSFVELPFEPNWESGWALHQSK